MAEKGLDKYIGKVNEKIGDGLGIVKLASSIPDDCKINTSNFLFDLYSGGGIPEGKVSILSGWEGAGKSTSAMKIVGNCLKKYEETNAFAVYCDTEDSYKPVWAEANGIDNDRVYMIESPSGEDCINAIASLIIRPEIKFVVLDSIAQLITDKQSETAAGDFTVGETVKLTKSLFNQVEPIMMKRRVNGDPVTLLLLNQMRSKLGTASRFPSFTSPGGHGLNFWSAFNIELKRAKEILGKTSTDQDVVIENECGFKITKSKLGPSGRDGVFYMNRNPEAPISVGTIDDYDTVLLAGRKYGLISGSKKTIYGIDHKFDKVADFKPYLINSPMEYIDLKANIIMLHRHEMGYKNDLPPDNYLLRWHSDDRVALPTNLEGENIALPGLPSDDD